MWICNRRVTRFWSLLLCCDPVACCHADVCVRKYCRFQLLYSALPHTGEGNALTATQRLEFRGLCARCNMQVFPPASNRERSGRQNFPHLNQGTWLGKTKRTVILQAREICVQCARDCVVGTELILGVIHCFQCVSPWLQRCWEALSQVLVLWAFMLGESLVYSCGPRNPSYMHIFWQQLCTVTKVCLVIEIAEVLY